MTRQPTGGGSVTIGAGGTPAPPNCATEAPRLMTRRVSYLDSYKAEWYIKRLSVHPRISILGNLIVNSQKLSRHFQATAWLVAVVTLTAALSALAIPQNTTRQEAEKAFAYGVGLYKDGLFKMALGRLNDYLVRYPDDAHAPQALFLTGECAFQLQDWKGCQDTMERFLALHPFHPLADDAALRLGQAALQAGNTSDALLWLERLPKDYPDSPLRADALYWSGEAHLEQHDTTAALDTYRQMVERHPDHNYTPWAAYTTGFIKEQQADTSGALAAYRVVQDRYVKSEPAAQAAYRAGNLLFRAGRNSEARQMLEGVAASLPPNAPMARHSRFLLGEIAYQAKDFTAAAEHYRAVLAVDSISDPAPQAFFAFAWLEGEAGHWSEAANRFEQAAGVLADKNLAAQALLEAGLAYQKAGESDKALQA